MANRRPLRGAFLIPPPQGAVADLETRIPQNALGVPSSIEMSPRIGDGVSLQLTSRDPWGGIRDIVRA